MSGAHHTGRNIWGLPQRTLGLLIWVVWDLETTTGVSGYFFFKSLFKRSTVQQPQEHGGLTILVLVLGLYAGQRTQRRILQHRDSLNLDVSFLFRPPLLKLPLFPGPNKCKGKSHARTKATNLPSFSSSLL